jgi:hypothetical protein
LGTVEDLSQALLQALKAAKGISRFEKVDFLVGKVEGGFDQGAEFRQLRQKGVHFPGKLALQRAHGATGGGCRRGVDQIDDRLGLRQVELAVEVRPARELAGFSESCTEFEAARQQHLHDHGSTVAVQFEDILAGEGAWRREVQQQPGVDHASVSRREMGERRHSGGRPFAADCLGKREETFSRDANDADTTATSGGRDGGYGCLRPCCRWRLFRHFRSSL